MKTTCLVGNTTELPDSFKYLLADNDVDVLATDTSSINSCYHLNFEKFNSREYTKCIAIYDSNFARYVHFDMEAGEVLTQSSKFARLCFDDGLTDFDCDLANACYMFRLYLLLHIICLSRNIELQVIDQGNIYTSNEFVSVKLLQFSGPSWVDTVNGFTLCSYHNSHNEFMHRLDGNNKLIVVVGDSWVVGDNQDKTKEWNVGKLKQSWTGLVATHYHSDLVVCGSPGNSNHGALLNFFIWYLHNQDFTNEYKDVIIIYSGTSAHRDISVYGNTGQWDRCQIKKEYIVSQRIEKLNRDSEIAVNSFKCLMEHMSLTCYYMINHNAHVRSIVTQYVDVDYIIRPRDNPLIHDFNHYFKHDSMTDSPVGYLSICGHPNDRGNEYLAQEVIANIKGF